jgi:predicted ATPase
MSNVIRAGIMTLAQKINYLGPLRQGPKRLYSYGERGSSNELGQDAEFFAYYLARFGNTKIDRQLCRPGTENQNSLSVAISNWAKQMKIVDEVQVKEAAGIGRQVEVVMPGIHRPITWDKVGIGVSQVLPVLLKVLSSDPGSVVLLEQPELHLHPDSQAELAEFLLQGAKSGRQIIVESHSDTLLTRLRRLVAESSVNGSDATRDNISFVFAYRDQATGVTEFENIELDNTGTFPKWPEGFADRAHVEAEALLKARLEALKKNPQ